MFVKLCLKKIISHARVYDCNKFKEKYEDDY